MKYVGVNLQLQKLSQDYFLGRMSHEDYRLLRGQLIDGYTQQGELNVVETVPRYHEKTLPTQRQPAQHQSIQHQPTTKYQELPAAESASSGLALQTWIWLSLAGLGVIAVLWWLI